MTLHRRKARLVRIEEPEYRLPNEDWPAEGQEYSGAERMVKAHAASGADEEKGPSVNAHLLVAAEDSD